MRFHWVHDYLLSMPGLSTNRQTDWNWQRYYVGDKMYAALAYDEQNALICITLKLPPDEGELLRNQYTRFLPGYYMNKQHWNSIYTDSDITDEALKLILDHAWQTGFQALTKKKQREINESIFEGSDSNGNL